MRPSFSIGCATASREHYVGWWWKAWASARWALSLWANQRETWPSQLLVHPRKWECARSRERMWGEEGQRWEWSLGSYLWKTCIPRVMSSFSVQVFCCWTRLSFTPLVASEIVGEVGFEADPDPCPYLHFSAHGIKGALKSQSQGRREYAFFFSYKELPRFLYECL